MEFTHHVSNAFGREPLTFFVKNYVLIYGGALPVIVALTYRGARKAPILLIALIAVVPFHFIAHRQYRFVASGVALMVLLIGLGTGYLLAGVAPTLRPGTCALVTGGWLVAMTAMSLVRPSRYPRATPAGHAAYTSSRDSSMPRRRYGLRKAPASTKST